MKPVTILMTLVLALFGSAVVFTTSSSGQQRFPQSNRKPACGCYVCGLLLAVNFPNKDPDCAGILAADACPQELSKMPAETRKAFCQQIKAKSKNGSLDECSLLRRACDGDVDGQRAVGAPANIRGVDAIARCSAELIPYAEWDGNKNPIKTVDLVSPAKGRLYYFPAGHSADPADPQFREIEEAWSKVKPTIAFYEGPNRPIAPTRDETIKLAGESGFVRFLATRDGIEIARLEPPPQDEANYIMQKFNAEQVKLFYVLREAARLRERRKMSEAELRTAIAELLKRASQIQGIGSVINNLDELDAAYRRYWKTPEHWWQAPMAWFDPLNRSEKTGGIFTNEINRMSSEYRNRYMYEVLAKAALEGKTVFAVVGGNHVPLQEPALRCALR